jgi:hypothetical protein
MSRAAALIAVAAVSGSLSAADESETAGPSEDEPAASRAVQPTWG